MFAKGVCWTPFPISIKLNVGEKVQTVPEPRIGRLVLFEDATNIEIAVVYGHVVYGVDIQDHDQRRDQLRETWNHIYVVPPLSAHAFCVPNTYEHLTILPYTPAPPMSFVATNDQKSTLAKFPSFDPTVGPHTDTVRLFYVTLRNTPHEHPPIEITLAHNRVCATTSLFESTCTTPLERAGIDELYDLPFGILQENCWYTTIDISHVVEDNRAIILHALLYIARFTNTCSDVKSAVPIYVAYDIDSMTSDVYTFKALPWQKQIRTNKKTASSFRTEGSEEKRKNAAFATPPLYDYSEHRICRMFLENNLEFQRAFGFYKGDANGSLHVPFTSTFEWAENISRHIRGSDDDPENSQNQQQQWFAPKLYNAVSQYTDDAVKLRYDGTTYSEKQAYGKIWSDVYWARMPDVRILFHTDTADGIPAFILQLLQCRTVAWQRLNWYTRYAFGIVQQVSEKAKRRIFAPDRSLSVYASQKDVERDHISKEGGSWFKSRDGTPRRFHPPAFGQYKLCDGVFVRDINGEYAFTKDPKLATVAYTYGFKQSSGRISVLFLFKKRGSKAHGGFYKIHFADIEGMPVLNGNYIHGKDISPKNEEYVLRDQTFVPCTSDDVDEPVYLYGKYEGEVLKVGEFFLYATHADGTSFVIPYKNVFIPSEAAVGKVGVGVDADAGAGVEVDADADADVDADADADTGGETNVRYMRVDTTTAEDKLQIIQTGCFIRKDDFPLVCMYAPICNLGIAIV